MNYRVVMHELHRLANPAIARGYARFGVPTEKALGIDAPHLRALAKTIGRDQRLSLRLWKTNIMEARALAALIGVPEEVTKGQMNRWAGDFDSWSVCDACCVLLFVYAKDAMEMSFRWSKDRREFVKRAGFALMASMAVHQKSFKDREFIPMLRVIREEAEDERPFVKKAINWALRQIGKRNMNLNALAIDTAMKIHAVDSPTARWVAADALRELRSEPVQRRLQKKMKKKSRH